MSELVACYYINNHPYNLYACYDNQKDYDSRRVAFYDLYDTITGVCLNKGCPYYSFPTYNEIYDFITEELNC